MSTAFGVKCDSLKNPDNEFRYWGQRYFNDRRSGKVSVAFLPGFLKFFSIPFMNAEMCAFFINTFNDAVAQRMENKETRHDFLNLVMQLMENGSVDPEADRNDDTNEDRPEKSGGIKIQFSSH